MAGYFTAGETKIRPGSYFHVDKNGGTSGTGVINGVTAVIFRSDFGPLGTVVELDTQKGYEDLFGTGGTTDAISQAFLGGAQTVLACRLGTGGTEASIVLKDTDGADAVTVTAKYPGTKAFAVTVKEKLSDQSVKQCIFYAGTKEVETFSFAAGAHEAQALAEAVEGSAYFTAEAAEGKNGAVLADVLQGVLSGGEDPTVKVGNYSDAFAAEEPYMFNTICVDTDDQAVHLLLAEFVERIYQAGNLTQAVVAEKGSVELSDRMAHAASYNDEKMNYVLNAKVTVREGENEKTLDGYQTAARIAGMIGAVSCRQSLTHMVIPDFTDLGERLTNTEVEKAETSGCIVLTMNTKREVWIDSAINTLISLPEDKDAGWKKIRRTKTRFELLRRCNEVTDALIGKVDNDSDGRNTILGKLNGVGLDMIAEGKIVSLTVAESNSYQADGDSCWFTLDVVDKDSAEHIYSFFYFQFSTNG